MQEAPRVALLGAVKEGKEMAAAIVRLQLRVARGHVSEEDGLKEYEEMLRKVDAIRTVSEEARAKVDALAPPIRLPASQPMLEGLAELSALASERVPDAQLVQERARVNGTIIAPAAQANYAAYAGQTGVLPEGGAGIDVRYVTLGTSDLGVAASAVTLPA